MTAGQEFCVGRDPSFDPDGIRVEKKHTDLQKQDDQDSQVLGCFLFCFFNLNGPGGPK